MENDFCRLARFGANITDAHSCFIFLPAGIASGCREASARRDNSTVSYSQGVSPSQGNHENVLELCGFHSLCRNVISRATIPKASGLIGWVAKHNRSIHVSPFDRDARTLGVYSEDESLKSLLAIPIECNLERGGTSRIGVVACDSKKAYAFSKLQGKLLEDLGREVASNLALQLAAQTEAKSDDSFDEFLSSTSRLIGSLGDSYVDILRIRLTSIEAVEGAIGTRRFIELVQLFSRLVRQSLPPYSPCLSLPTGELLLAVDNMMTAFMQNKARAIANHISPRGVTIYCDFAVTPCKGVASKQGRGAISALENVISRSVSEQLLKQNHTGAATANSAGRAYEYRRA